MEILRPAPQMTLLRLDPGSGKTFEFHAGQYARLTFAGFQPRDYSIGSRPDQPYLEFHIRDTGDGGSSSYVAAQLRIGDEVRIDGPHGNGFLRHREHHPILAIAGGSGLASIKSIVETALLQRAQGEVHLYFGARRTTDLYLADQLEALAAQFGNFHYQAVLSEEAVASGARSGLVTDAVSEDFADLSDFAAYLAGPPAMVKAGGHLLLRLGLPETRLYADAFARKTLATAKNPV